MRTYKPLRLHQPLKRRAACKPPSLLHPDKRYPVSASEWREIRGQVFDRSGGFCEAPVGNGSGMYTESRCMRRIYWSTWEPHHIVPRRDGGQDSTANVIAVCRSCHERLDGRVLHWTRPA